MALDEGRDPSIPSALLLVLIHRSAWNRNSRKLPCRIVYSPEAGVSFGVSRPSKPFSQAPSRPSLGVNYLCVDQRFTPSRSCVCGHQNLPAEIFEIGRVDQRHSRILPPLVNTVNAGAKGRRFT
jgi:hypothetical protein